LLSRSRNFADRYPEEQVPHIRRRLVRSFLTILVLFGLNLGVYSVSNVKRRATVEALRRAISSQILIAEINQRLNDTQKQMALLGEAVTDSAAGASPDEIASFSAQLESVKRKIQELTFVVGRHDSGQGGSICERLRRVERFLASLLQELWCPSRYRDHGVGHAGRSDEPAAFTADRARDTGRGEETMSKRQREFLFRRSCRGSHTAFIFLFSGLVAIVIALRLSRHIHRGLSELKTGADRIGSGTFDQPIEIRSRDELGELAAAFNAMSAQLYTAHSSLTQANQELASRHEEVQRQREISDSLLRNILPAQIAEELREKSSVDPKYFEDVTILFTDFVGFSNSTRICRRKILCTTCTSTSQNSTTSSAGMGWKS
jgi:HAMP domain-containing protein